MSRMKFECACGVLLLLSSVALADSPTARPDDPENRPEIRDGTWYLHGNPVFFTGTIINGMTKRDWKGPETNPLGIDHPAYVNPPSKALFESLGLSSVCFIGKYLPIEPGFAKGFGDLPVEADFSRRTSVYSKERSKELDQVNPSWHTMIPFCPECSEGREYYRRTFTDETTDYVASGLNIYLYEVFNESSYGCRCRANLEEFARRSNGKYTTATDFSRLETDPEMWYDWCRFTADRYVEICLEAKKAIRSVDTRARLYFCEQCAGSPPTHRTMDYRKLADALDVLATEGGFRYGFSRIADCTNEMEGVVVSGGTKQAYNCDFYEAVTKSKKPFHNHEHYSNRVEDGKRVPNHRSDYPTSLWLETMHGASGSYYYFWDKRSWEYKTHAEAKAFVEKPSWRSSSFLNPYNVRPEDLDAFKDFQRELEPIADRVMPRPRLKPATVAVFFSMPSQIHWKRLRQPKLERIRSNHRDSVTSQWYLELLHRQFPLRVVFEEDLDNLGSEVQALVFPGTQCVLPGTVEAVRRFRARGGLVIADLDSFTCDQYMKPLAEKYDDCIRVTDGRAAAEELLKAGVRRYCVLKPLDEKGDVRKADAQIIDRGEFKLVCVAAMGEKDARRVRLCLSLDGDGAYAVKNHVTKEILKKDGRDVWSVAALANGIDLTLPSQERVLITLEKK